jgi:arginine N-succinyltransferase
MVQKTSLLIENRLVKNKRFFTFRPIRAVDSPMLYDLLKEARGGLSNLPKTLHGAKKLAIKSTQSFQNKRPKKNKAFMFVIENNEKKIVGISGIKARVGVERATYSFQMNTHQRHPTLELTQQFLGPSEIGSLFLSPDYRNQGIGRLLSLSRFLFVRLFKEQFTKTITAELRGYLHKNNVSPFWNKLGKKFINVSFNNADIQSVKDVHFIDQNFPKNPIYIQLLDPSIMPYLGAVHPFTEPAKKLLLGENFNITNQIDIFDGGPKLECLSENIRTYKEAKESTLNKLMQTLGDESVLIANQKFQQFRCIRANNQTPLSQIKHQLNIQEKDPILYVKEKK